MPTTKSTPKSTPKTPPLAIATLTTNRKVGPGQVYVTHASQGSCPASCPFMGSGCYAENGPQGFTTRRLNRAQAETGADSLAVAQDEARAIDGLKGDGRALRLHVVGDCPTPEAARLVGAAVGRWQARGGGAAWTYTHAWRDVPPHAWGFHVSVLASCETDADIDAARRQGYTPAVVVDRFPEGGRAFERAGHKLIPCPEQTGKAASCADCRLCWDAGALFQGKPRGIAFQAHGATKKIGAALSAKQASCRQR